MLFSFLSCLNLNTTHSAPWVSLTKKRIFKCNYVLLWKAKLFILTHFAIICIVSFLCWRQIGQFLKSQQEDDQIPWWNIDSDFAPHRTQYSWCLSFLYSIQEVIPSEGVPAFKEPQIWKSKHQYHLDAQSFVLHELDLMCSASAMALKQRPWLRDCTAL